MGVVSWLNRPGIRQRLWRPAYEAGYGCLKAAVLFVFRPVFRVRRVGRRPVRPPRGQGFVLCANHASYLDPAFIQIAVRPRVTFVMTNDFYARPAGRWFFALVGAVPVGRGRLARKGLRRAMALVKRGHPVVLFPEGRLSPDGEPTRAQRGIGRLARRTGVPIYPIGIAGNFRAWPTGRSYPRSSDVRVKFGSPMTWADEQLPNTRAGQQAFADRLMARIVGLRASILEDVPSPVDREVSGNPTSDVQESEQGGR